MGLRESNSPTAALERGGEDGWREVVDGEREGVCGKGMKGDGGRLRRFGKDMGTGRMRDDIRKPGVSNKRLAGREHELDAEGGM